MLDRLYGDVSAGRLIFSDALPFCLDELFIPKPFISFDSKKTAQEHKDSKMLKKLAYISVTELNAYLACLKGESAAFLESQPEVRTFGVANLRTMVAIKGNEQPQPFNVGTFEFLEDCGLYIIAAFEGEDQFKLMKKLLTLLSHSGIGGKRTAGLGSFGLEEINLQVPSTPAQKRLAELLVNDKADYHMTLNVSLPKDEELDDAIKEGWFGLVRRGGFVQSRTYAPAAVKKRVIYLLSAGSCLKKRFEGDILDVSVNGTHPVYRLAKPLFMGVAV